MRFAAKPGTTPAATGPRIKKGRGRRDADGDARALKHARYALWKNPENLTDRQRHKLDWIAKTDPRLYRGYLLKEGLRYVFAVKGQDGNRGAGPLAVLGAALPDPSVRAPRQAHHQRPRADHRHVKHGLSNALIESVNTKIRLITRIAFGFRSPQALIALAMLSLGGHRPVLPCRKNPRINQ